MNSPERGLYIGHRFIPWSQMSEHDALLPDVCRKWAGNKEFFSLFSSGSTGAPKEILFAKDALLWSALNSRNALDLGDDEHALCVLPLNKTGGFMLLFRCMAFNWNCTIMEPSSDPMLQLKSDHCFTLLSLVPLQIQTIMQNEESVRKLNRFRTVLMGGAPLNDGIINKILVLNARIFETYGMTETASHIALRRINGPKPDLYLKPLKGVLWKVDAQQHLMIMAPVTNNQWIRTNDLVQECKEGFLLLGRLDSVINSGGIKIYPEQIEAIVHQWLEEQGYPTDCMAASVPNVRLGQQLVLLVPEPVQWQLHDLPDSLFPYHHKPRQIIVDDTLKRTETGKWIRKA